MMKETILITGRGAIANHLNQRLSGDYHIKFLTRRKTNDHEYAWNVDTGYIDSQALQDVNHVIHLAGANIVERWTKKKKKEIISSRVDSAKLILKELQKQDIKINSFISASAAGYYGAKTTDKIFTEEDECGNDFLSEVCGEWEKAARKFEDLQIPVAILRFGLVLSKQGALQKMDFPVRFNMGACLGKGKQFIPWIHIDDVCSMIQFVLKNKVTGIFNAVAPDSVTNKEMTHLLAQLHNKKIWLPDISPFLVKLLFGEASVLLLEGSRVSSQKILDKGFCFKYEKLEEALKNLLIK